MHQHIFYSFLQWISFTFILIRKSVTRSVIQWKRSASRTYSLTNRGRRNFFRIIYNVLDCNDAIVRSSFVKTLKWNNMLMFPLIWSVLLKLFSLVFTLENLSEKFFCEKYKHTSVKKSVGHNTKCYILITGSSDDNTVEIDKEISMLMIYWIPWFIKMKQLKYTVVTVKIILQLQPINFRVTNLFFSLIACLCT